MNKSIKDKIVLITGGAGTIGSGILKEVLKHEPKTVRVIDNDETRLFELEQEFRKHKNIRYLLGDIRDKERTRTAMNGVGVVFHAAALKHVSACEYNSFEAIKTNILGLQNVIDAAIEAGVERLIFTSSDKAVNPTNVMGTTKLLGEKLVTAANYYKGSHDIKLASVRFGNVIGSRGSVVPLFKKQVENGGPLTVTDPEMTRFMMSAQEAVALIIKSLEIMKGGEVFILKMPVFKLSVLVEAMKELSERDVETEIIDAKPGEKKFEELMTLEESKRALETDDMFIVLPEMKELLQRNDYNYPGAKKAEIREYSSKTAAVLPKSEIKLFLKNINVI